MEELLSGLLSREEENGRMKWMKSSFVLYVVVLEIVSLGSLTLSYNESLINSHLLPMVAWVVKPEASHQWLIISFRQL